MTKVSAAAAAGRYRELHERVPTATARWLGAAAVRKMQGREGMGRKFAKLNSLTQIR